MTSGEMKRQEMTSSDVLVCRIPLLICFESTGREKRGGITGARARSYECTSKYPIPAISSISFKHTNPDLLHVIYMLKRNSGTHRPTLDLLRGNTNPRAHSLWMSNLFLDLTRPGSNQALESYETFLSAAVTNHRPTIVNTLLVWYMFLGGHIEEETLGGLDRLCVVVLLFLFSG